MSKTLLNRLAMFEILDACGPLSISELARLSGLDVSVVSRTVAACEPDGWVDRSGTKLSLGPRFTLLGNRGPIADVVTRAAPLVHAIAGVTGLLTHAYGLVGTQSVLIASAAGRGPVEAAGLGVKAPLYATAGGRAIAVQLEPDRLSLLLPPEPFPDASALVAAMAGTSAEQLFPAPEYGRESRPSRLASNRAELDRQLDDIRGESFAIDQGALDPAVHCVAVAWCQSALPASIGCLGPIGAIESNADMIRAVLGAAVLPGATPASILTAGSAGTGATS